jgi:hypothetical protein
MMAEPSFEVSAEICKTASYRYIQMGDEFLTGQVCLKTNLTTLTCSIHASLWIFHCCICKMAWNIYVQKASVLPNLLTGPENGGSTVLRNVCKSLLEIEIELKSHYSWN